MFPRVAHVEKVHSWAKGQEQRANAETKDIARPRGKRRELPSSELLGLPYAANQKLGIDDLRSCCIRRYLLVYLPLFRACPGPLLRLQSPSWSSPGPLLDFSWAPLAPLLSFSWASLGPLVPLCLSCTSKLCGQGDTSQVVFTSLPCPPSLTVLSRGSCRAMAIPVSSTLARGGGGAPSIPVPVEEMGVGHHPEKREWCGHGHPLLFLNRWSKGGPHPP